MSPLLFLFRLMMMMDLPWQRRWKRRLGIYTIIGQTIDVFISTIGIYTRLTTRIPAIR
jgi:hypothetical protein